MSYIEKEKLLKADIVSIENKVRHAFNQGYDLGFKDGKEKAKPLEKEPILDKIRAEMKPYTDSKGFIVISENRFNMILDKYKGES